VSRVRQLETTLAAKAALLDEITQARHVRLGYTSTENALREWGDVESFYNHDDDNDGQWTAMYLASQCFRWAVTGEQEARENAGWHENVVVKIPMGKEGLAAVSILEKEGIRCNVTLVFSAAQGYTAALAGASFVSPFVGRLDDIGIPGMEVVADLAEIFDLHGFQTRIIAASIRHPQHVEQAALAGAHIATVPTAVVRKLVEHPLTDIGLEKFLSDWNK